ncbi:zf-HC2 domain-containing protein [Paenibacillus lautus]|uniref:zf-HC2 domain-containing protein n=1 Tax=Paenibacillus lautus TaxID=1401 RepID=UPI002DBE5363|nr:zf-HC2 domain-containing protein [Paenibacillus lautus]MEC0307767.1 zf-HC2 domain-containing protein [Paenibacillus lautus]
MSRVSCDIIQDLLPLYYDDVCSADTKALVEGHLADCPDCREVLSHMSSPMPLPAQTIEQNKQEGAGLQQVAAQWSRTKWISFSKGLLITCLVVGLLFLVYVGLFKWNITSVPTRVMQVSDISQLKDGRIVYHVKMTDGYNVNQASIDSDADGNLYMTPKRPIIKSKKFANMGLSNMYYFNDIKERNAYEKSFGEGVQIKALYLGTPDDRILIWEQGMELPAASESVEMQFNSEEIDSKRPPG